MWKLPEVDRPESQVHGWGSRGPAGCGAWAGARGSLSPGLVLSHRTMGLPGTGHRLTALGGHSLSLGTDLDHHCSTLERILFPFKVHDLGFRLHWALATRQVPGTQRPLALNLLVCKMQKIPALPSSQGAWNNWHHELENDSETVNNYNRECRPEKKNHVNSNV